jgi:hypothetical protein
LAELVGEREVDEGRIKSALFLLLGDDVGKSNTK